jgi:hypothetical protein
MPLTRSGIYLHQIRTSTNAVLQFDHNAHGLVVWKWYVYALLMVNHLYYSLKQAFEC